ncbi:hypothetical protein ARMSODRAFT_971389 [Armillaria solidipes]|uniref:Uncharacterized protein n=1 Tax=Armillaria solidipes TaxID=1076256 RepID=A0A2H3BTE6_9AGAR|nr:hypothetical protein ARMSODRAFT_971389 [Armillaria solidipes]
MSSSVYLPKLREDPRGVSRLEEVMQGTPNRTKGYEAGWTRVKIWTSPSRFSQNKGPVIKAFQLYGLGNNPWERGQSNGDWELFGVHVMDWHLKPWHLTTRRHPSIPGVKHSDVATASRGPPNQEIGNGLGFEVSRVGREEVKSSQPVLIWAFY